MPIEIKNQRDRTVILVEPMVYNGNPTEVLKYMITWKSMPTNWVLVEPEEMKAFCTKMLETIKAHEKK